MSIGDPILWVELVMLSALLTAGICAAWTDLRFQRVPNRYTLGLLGIGVAGQVAMVGLSVGGWNQVAGTLLLALTIALLLTLVGVWSPGDAKMYWAAVASLPPSLCPVGQWISLATPPAALIVNALAAYVAVLLGAVAWRLHRQRGRRQEAVDPAPGLGWCRDDGGRRGVEHARQGTGQHLLLGGLVPQHQPSYQLQRCV
ncbi:MAG: hypothetical protein OXG13_08380 [Gemmatimonadaceae bacterium]|nr:hypothetical protein [Gemmatimonadaceae bacterium]